MEINMSMYKVLAGSALAILGTLGVAAKAHPDVQWSVTIGAPCYAPAPVYTPAPVYRAPAPGYWQHGYHQPRYWDRDGDGIPNRYDRLYNPRWDRDGDGIPNRYDRFPDGRHGWQGGYGNGGAWNGGRGSDDHRGGGDWRGGQGGRDRHDVRPSARGY